MMYQSLTVPQLDAMRRLAGDGDAHVTFYMLDDLAVVVTAFDDEAGPDETVVYPDGRYDDPKKGNA